MIVSPSTANKPAYWLLTMEVMGRTYRYATDAIEVPFLDGSVQPFHAGLSDLSIKESTSAGRSVGVSVIDPSAAWHTIVARNGRLGGGRAELVLYFEGQVYEQALWAAEGVVEAADYGSSWEPLEFSIAPEPNQSIEFPRPSNTVSKDTVPLQGFTGTFPNEKKQGVRYPFVFGQPGKDGGLDPADRGVVDQILNFGGQFATPAYVHQWGRFKGAGAISGIVEGYSSNTLILSGDWVEATQVVVYPASATGGAWNDRIDVVQGYDALGQRISYLVADSATRWAFAPDGEYWVSWDTGAGIPTRSASGIIKYMMTHVGARVDTGMWSATDADLGHYMLDCAITEGVDPDAWVKGQLGDFLPIVQVAYRDGVHYRVVPYQADPSMIVAHLDGSISPSSGMPVQRQGSVRFGSERDVLNQVTLQYARIEGKKYAKQVVLSPESTYASQMSYMRYGLRETRITCDVAWDDATAQALGQALLKWRALPRRTIQVGGSLELLRIPLLCVVQYREDEIDMRGELAVVMSRTITLRGVDLDLTLCDQPGMIGWEG